MSKTTDFYLRTMIRWSINNYSDEKNFYESDQFLVPGSFGKIKLSLEFHTKSSRRQSYSSVYLKLFPSTKLEITFKYKLYIVKDSREINAIQFTNHFTRSETRQGIRCGMTDFISRNDILKLLDDNGTLKIHCRFKVINFSCRLSGNLMPLLINCNYSDAVVYVEGCEFRVQKAVVSARSQVFNALFEKSSKINIEDENIDAQTFSKLLLFIYTGKFSFDGDLKLIDAVNKFRIA